MQAGTWYQIPGKAPSQDFKTPSTRIVDLVRMSIKAHRARRGDIVWTCWQPGGAGVEIGDIRRVNSGAMLIMLNPRGADAIAQQIARDASTGGPMQPWHFDLALKSWLLEPEVNKAMRACYVFPPVGNYTTHVSGCDPTFAVGEGRPNCWREAWTCPGTRVAEDPMRRDKRFMAWAGDAGYTDVGSAAVDIRICGHVEWLTFWQGVGAPPSYRPEEERRPQKVLKRPAANQSTGVEPSATSRGPEGKGPRQQGPPRTTTTQGVVQRLAGPTGKGKPTTFSLWPDRPGPGQPPLDSDPVEQWEDLTEEGQAPATTTKRQRRNIRAALLNRSFRQWVRTREEVRH